MNDQNDNSSRKVKERIKTLIIIALIIIIIILLLKGCNGESFSGHQNHNGQDNATEIIVDDETTLQDASNGTIRIKMNPVVTVKQGVMDDLNFCNYNEGRILRLKITVGNQCVYESGDVSEGEVLKSASLNTKHLEMGENKAVAQVFSYDLTNNLMGQTNVELIIDYIN